MINQAPLSEPMDWKLRDALGERGWFELRLTMIRGELKWRASAHRPEIRRKKSKKRPALYRPDRWFRAVSTESADHAAALLLDKIG